MKQHNVHKGTHHRRAPEKDLTQKLLDVVLEEMREAGRPKKGEKYLELESLMKFPVETTKEEIMGKVVTNDDHTISQGVISDAKKEGRAKDGIQMWRVTTQITDPTILEAFGQIPAFKKKIKKMK